MLFMQILNDQLVEKSGMTFELDIQDPCAGPCPGADADRAGLPVVVHNFFLRMWQDSADAATNAIQSIKLHM